MGNVLPTTFFFFYTLLCCMTTLEGQMAMAFVTVTRVPWSGRLANLDSLFSLSRATNPPCPVCVSLPSKIMKVNSQ